MKLVKRLLESPDIIRISDMVLEYSSWPRMISTSLHPPCRSLRHLIAMVLILLGIKALNADPAIPGFALIPGGSFTMGRTSGDADSDAPPIVVTVSSYYLAEKETTKAQWNEVWEWGLSNGYTDISDASGEAPTHPVQFVGWSEVVKWCNARSEKEGLTPVYTVSGAVMRTGPMVPDVNWSANGYRLPTEAEWEKAARGGVEGKRFPWGNDTISHAQSNFTNFGGEAYATGTTGAHPNYEMGSAPYTSPVGSFGANGYGLYDMAGNVSEWCWDLYDSNHYTTSAGTTDPRGASSGFLRVLRGGSWNRYASYARCATRGSSNGSRSGAIGFRPARSLEAIVGSAETGDVTVDTGCGGSIYRGCVARITTTGATLGGSVTNAGGATITERGVVYPATTTNADPVIGGTGVTRAVSGTTGIFTIAITGLPQGVSHNFKAYAINSQGTSYTNVASFSTLSTNSDLSALILSSGTLNPTFTSNTTTYTANVIHSVNSITVTPTAAQFVFLDASHEYEDVRDDIESWYPKVKRGGVLAGHGYSRTESTGKAYLRQ